MADDTLLTDLVDRSTRTQSLVFNALAITCLVMGLGIGLLLLLIPAKPGEENAVRVVAVFAAGFVVAGVWLKRWVGAKIGRIRATFLHSPESIVDAKIVPIKVNSFTTYAVHVKNREGETLGLSVPSEALAQDIVARLRQGMRPN